MILNHKTAIELLVENVDTAEFNRYTLMNLHSALAENLLPNPADEDLIRQHAVDIGKSVDRPLPTPQQIDDALDILLNKVNRIRALASNRSSRWSTSPICSRLPTSTSVRRDLQPTCHCSAPTCAR
jgi:hypothetical protein